MVSSLVAVMAELLARLMVVWMDYLKVDLMVS